MARGTARVVVITGASSGIGRATARAFASKGARLVLAARNGSALADVVEECAARGAEAIAVPTDVSDEEQVRALAARALESFGRIDVWVGVASVFSYGRFEDTPPEVFRQVIETNLSGQVYSARAVLPQFRRQGRGMLVLVGSLYSRVTAPYVSPYVTAKFALLGFAGALRKEVLDAPRIHVCSVLPATIDTPIYQHAANYTGRTPHPLPPIASPERVARAIVRVSQHPRRVTTVGRIQSASIVVQALTPGFYDRVTRLIMRRLGLRATFAPASSGTVFAPVDDGMTVTGGWRSARLRALTVTAMSGVGALLLLRRRR